VWTARDANRFVVGVNLPWISYGTDVGANAWFPHGGLSRQPAALDLLDRTFASLAADGMSVVRVFLLCDARSGVRFDDDGVPIGIDDVVFADVESLIGAARRHQVGVMPVLFDFHLCGPPRIVDRVQLGGRSRLIVDGSRRRALVDRVVRPIVERFGDEEAVVAWDIINEPEWCLRGGLFQRTSVTFDAMQCFLRDVVECVRGAARQPVTVGCAGTWRLNLVKPLGLDFYQIHWYERFGWSALTRPVAELGLDDRPVILGEFAGRSVRIHEILAAAKDAGYEGALVWSALAEDEHSAYPAALGEWVRARVNGRVDRASS
jgi:hypothetical protein